MAESMLPHQRRRRHAFGKIASTLCLCGSFAALIDLGADEATRSSLLTILKSRPGGSSASATSSSSSSRNVIGGRTGVSGNFRLLGGVSKIKPGRMLKAALLKTHLRFNPFPTTAGQQCERHWDPANDRWVTPEQAQAVPAGSRFAESNIFFTKVDFNALNILVVGDSIGENMALFLENSHSDLGVYMHQRESYREQINPQGRYQDRIWVNHVPEEKGGGYVAFARLVRWHVCM